MPFNPWADRFRPTTLEEIFGQKELVGPNKFLKKSIQNDELPSLIFWGPPGCGKTSLAHVIAKTTESRFISFSAAVGGVAEIKKIIKEAEEFQQKNYRTILFIDEIHRFNKKQQDVLLPHVEKGIVTLIGATTENPSFEVNAALLSRARVFVLERLKPAAVKAILKNTLKKAGKDSAITQKIPKTKLKITEDHLNLIAYLANGDARTAINVIQGALESSQKINRKIIKEIFQKSHLLYDKGGEEHYNIISALHKSMRGGDPDAALYWLARMIEGGEPPLYVARRLVRFASEDIGLANNSAMMLAVSTYQACHFLGYPECDVHLAQCVAYLAKSKKDIRTYRAIKRARGDATKFGNLPVPLHLRNAPTGLMKDLGYGKDYQYSPDHNWQEDQEYFPKELKKRKYLN